MQQNEQKAPNWRELIFYGTFATLITILNASLTAYFLF